MIPFAITDTRARRLPAPLFLTTLILAALAAIGTNCATAPDNITGSVAYKQVVGVIEGEEIPLVIETAEGTVPAEAADDLLPGSGGARFDIDPTLESTLHEKFAAVGYRVGIRLDGGGKTEIHYVDREGFNALEIGHAVKLDAARMTLATESDPSLPLLF